MEDLVASTLSSTLKIPHAVARFLVSRGIKTVSDAYHMLCCSESDVHDPFLMMGMDKAVEWILAVRERGERVFIFWRLRSGWHDLGDAFDALLKDGWH